jgi:acyl-CoA synthetase (NDP forming)
MINENKEIKTAIIITDEFLEWEERDAAHITLLRHCIAGM